MNDTDNQDGDKKMDRRQEVLNIIVQSISEFQENTPTDVMDYTYDDWLQELAWYGYPRPTDTFGFEHEEINDD